MSGRGIVALNMTGFFKRQLQMYALGDIKFKKPIPIKQVAYVILFYIIWAIPLIAIFGIVLHPAYAVLVLVPPLILGSLAVKPSSILGDRNIIDFVIVSLRFMGEPKNWADLKVNEADSGYTLNTEIWVSRRRELQMLADLVEDGRK